MSRFPILTAAIASAALVFLPLHPADAATKKKKSSSTAKKKAATSAAKKKAAAESGEAGADADKKPGAASTLDLPLPVKPAPTGAAPGSAETKPVESAPPAPKSAEKSGSATAASAPHAPNATIELENLTEFAAQPPRIQQLLRDAIDLTRLNLTYTFGSADPDNGGMDCSGTIYYLLKAHGFNDVARDSTGQYLWLRKGGAFFPVLSRSEESVELNELLPGDLMFWTGTYEPARDIPVSHVMLYLGREKATGQRIMFGASDGRSYQGVQRWGVSVFDFKMPRVDPANPEKKAKADFVGFARVPGLRSPAEKTAAAGESAKQKPKPTPAPRKKKSSRKSK